MFKVLVVQGLGYAEDPATSSRQNKLWTFRKPKIHQASRAKLETLNPSP